MTADYIHHGGHIELHGHKTVPKQYRGALEVSNRTFPSAPNFFVVQLTRMSVVILFMSAVFVLGPLLYIRRLIGGWEVSLICAGLILGILVVLYAIYLNFWMQKFKFKFFPDYIDVTAGVFRRIERSVPFSGIRNIRVNQDMFERMGNVAHIRVENAITGGVLEGDQSTTLTLMGFPVDEAYRLADIINSCIRPEHKNK
ncbi:MAG: PH domain-containing protein [Candidatus Paceibacterota bacterium]|jgi:uncharacterized membrane protein YdbT with pleckstrin-like domain